MTGKASEQVAEDVVRKAVWSAEKAQERCGVLHADNGSPQKGSHLGADCWSLGV